MARSLFRWSIGLLAAVAATCVVFAAGAAKDVEETGSIFALCLALFIAGALVGAFTGLLFGMPREAARVAVVAGQAQPRFEMNSNLLKVSDWVTTIIVGLSLVKIAEIPDGLERFGDWVAPGLGSEPASASFALFLTMGSFVACFILMYIWTALPFRIQLEGADRDTVNAVRHMTEAVAGATDPEQAKAEMKQLSDSDLAEAQRVTREVAQGFDDERRQREAR